MDERMIAMMIFLLLLVLIAAGVFLLYPVSRRLGLFLEARMQDKPGITAATDRELARLRAVVDGLELQLRAISDRQEFVEKMLDARGRDLLLSADRADRPT